MSKAKVKAVAERLVDHGRQIFVYNQIWTNQVIYSLERSMNNNQVLKQLAFAGKKTLPSSLRKDMWRPLMTVTFPSPHQGLHAFRKLREYRKLHELHWTDPERNNDKPAVFDEVRKQRSAAIMNQKANTVADLAKVLLEQEELRLIGAESLQRKQDAAHQRAQQDMLDMRQEIDDGGLEAASKAVNEQQQIVDAMRLARDEKKPDAPSRGQLRKATFALESLDLKHKKMLAAKSAFDSAEAGAVARSEATGKEVEVPLDTPGVFYQQINAEGRPYATNDFSQEAPLYTTDGVVVRWANPLDAEFAESWPNAVRHEALGLTRHTAIKSEDEPVFDTADLHTRNMSRKQQESRAALDAAAA